MSAPPNPVPPVANPDDWMQDAKGRWTPKASVKAVDMARHELVLELVERARKTSTILSAFKRDAMGDVKAFIQLSAEQYGVKISGAKGNVTLLSFDGKYKIVRSTNERLVFDERLQVAKSLIDDCIKEWSGGTDDKLRALVNHAFQVERGEVSTARVLSLRQLAIDHPKWAEAMRAITDSFHVAETRAYLRFYERNDETGEYVPISLDLASIRGAE